MPSLIYRFEAIAYEGIHSLCLKWKKKTDGSDDKMIDKDRTY